MRIESSDLEGVLVMTPAPHHDDRGFFVRTFDATLAREHGIRVEELVQDSQSRSHRGVIRGLHGRGGAGEAKLVRCARGAVWDVVVDIRIGSATFGRWQATVLDDQTFRHLYVPPGFLHGFQVLTDESDVCYRIDREHDPTEDLSVHYADPELAVPWPAAPALVSVRDGAAPSWSHLLSELRG